MNTQVSDAKRQSWLDFEIIPISDEVVERNRFILLGLIVMAGGLIPNDGGLTESALAQGLFMGLLGGTVLGCWQRSPLWFKATLMVVGSAVSFVHRELPVPGVGHGFLSSEHWPANGRAIQALALLFTIHYLPALVVVGLFHLCLAVFDFIETRLVQWHILPSRRQPEAR